MRKRVLGTAVLLCMLMLVFVLTVGATDFTGYTAIGTPDELLALMANSDAWGEKYYLTADIVLPEESAQTPIGVSASKPFKGVFDGDGHKISGVALSGASNLGLFGVADGATIQNLVVEGSVTGTGNNVGGIVGFAYMNCTVSNCTANVSVSGAGSSGGTGGVVGKVGGSTVGTFVLENCTNKGTVNGKLYTGGIIGLDQHTGAASTTTITGCKNYGTVTGTSSCTAGILGYYYVSVQSTLELSQCANYGDIQGAGYTGGVLGAHINAGKADTYAITSSLSELYNCGAVSGTAATTGGVIGSYQTTSASGSMTISDLMHAGESASLAVFGAVNGSTPLTLSRLYNSVGDAIAGTAAETVTLDNCVTAGGDTSALTGDAWTQTKDGAMLTAFYMPKVLLEVVYLKSGGTGDGSSAEYACGTYTDAFEALDLTKDCTIVICDRVTQTKNYNFGEEYTGSITFTSVYGGVDYRESGAVLNVGAVRFVCCGDTRFENIHINATGASWYLIASHHPLTMGEGIEVTGESLTGTTFAKSIAILGGYQSGVNNPPLSDDKDVNITILSGSMYYIIPFNRGVAGTYSGNANIYIGGNAEVATLHGSAATDGSSVGNVYVTLTDNASIRTFYGSTQDMTENSFTLYWCSGSIGAWDWDCPAISDKHITYTEGTALYALSAARSAANYSEIAAKFDKALPYTQWCAEHGGHAYANGVCTVCGDIVKQEKLAIALDEGSVVLLATVDSLDYASVGFAVTANGVTKSVDGLTTVYRSVTVGDVTYTVDNFTSGIYLAACVIEGLPTTDVTFELITFAEA